MRKIIENRINDALMLTKKTYIKNGFICINRAGYKKVSEKNILKTIDFIKSINGISSLNIDFNNIVVIKSTSLLQLNIDNRIFIATSSNLDNRFIINDIAFSDIA